MKQNYINHIMTFLLFLMYTNIAKTFTVKLARHERPITPANEKSFSFSTQEAEIQKIIYENYTPLEYTTLLAHTTQTLLIQIPFSSHSQKCFYCIFVEF